MAPKFVTARHKGVLKRIRVPEQSLKYMPGWEIVPAGKARGRKRSAPKTSRQRQAPVPPEVNSTPTPSPEGDQP